MDETLAPGTRLGPYEIEVLIGAGGMGQVYRARDPRLDRNVAIKTLSGSVADHTDGIRRFETEARAAGTLDHPNLLVVYDVGREGDISYIVSELLEGETLRERLRRQGTLPERQAIDFGVQIANGLAAAHARGIVHRDLKPENLFVTRDRRVKILDFGVAKLTEPADGGNRRIVAETLTALGVMVGTVGYMAPEQVLGETIDQRADIFALGVVLHEMLSGAAPFQRNTAVATLNAILNEEAPNLPASIGPGLERIVHRCLEKQRADRFYSAHDLGLALDLAVPTTGTGASAPARPAAVPRRKVLTYGASSLALLASGFAGGTLVNAQARSAEPPSFRRLTFRRGLIRSARVAPDGQTILYGALWDGDPCRVHSVRLDSPESSPLDLPEANVLAISRSGEIALALGPHIDGVVTYGTLARVPMAGGAPRELVENVKAADWSPDGADLAIVRNVDGRDRLEYPIGNILVAPGVGQNTGLSFARVSPDGRHVAYTHCRSPGSLLGHVSMVDRSGRVTPLTDEYLNIHGLAWRGAEILYTAADERPLFRALCAVSPGSAPRTITRMPGNATLWDALPDGRLVVAHTDDRAVMIARLPSDTNDRDLSWLDASWASDLTPDGRLILFNETGQGGGPQSTAYLRGTNGSPAIRLGSGAAYALSPDGRWALCAAPDIAFTGTASPHMEIVPTGAGESRQVQGNGLGFTDARWLPDGKRIIASAIEPGRRTRLYLLDTEQGRPAALTPEGVLQWAVAPDGSAVAASGPSPTIRLYPVNGAEPHDVPGMTGRERLVGWIHNGLLVILPRDSASQLGDIHSIDIRTGRRNFWRNILPHDNAGIMVMVQFRTTPDGRTQAYTWHRALSNLYIADGVG